MTGVPFQRTNTGKAAKARFVGRPICYVEGDEDVAFFYPIAERLGIRFESAYGKPNVMALAGQLVGARRGYLVLVDNDFDDLLGLRICDPRIVYVPAYSIENLFAIDGTLNGVVASYCAVSGVYEEASMELEKFVNGWGEVIEELVVFDFISRAAGDDCSLVPRHADILFANRPGLKLCPRWCAAFTQEIDRIRARIDAARTILVTGSRKDAILRYLRGHVVFGILRRIFIKLVKKRTGSKPSLDNRAFLRLLSEVFWRDAAHVARGMLSDIQTAKLAA